MRDSVDEFGFSFKKAIYSGCKNLDSGVGVYAGSHDSYYKWHELFDQVIEKYHGHGKDDKHKSDMNADNVNAPEFPEHESKMIKSTRIRVGRNLKDYPLGPGLSKEQRLEVNEKIVTALKSFTGDLAGTYYDLGSMNDKQRQQLIDDHFLFKEGDRFLECCGLNREWPEGRGIFHNDAKTFLVWVNEEDQLRIISMQQGSNIKEVFSRLSRACSHIETVAKFSHDDHLGYITSCPSNLGTALRASVHIHLPNLGQDKQLFESIADKYNVQIRGAHGEHSETDDHIYDISNKRRLGLSEVQLVQDMYDGVKAMIQKETELTPKVAETEVQAGSHLKKPEDLTGFINFPEGTKSLLCKYLTKEIWDKYKNESDVHGFTFKQAILSGAQNVDSGIGVYAGSHSSYVSFADMFDKIIEDYHQHSKEAVHKSNMDHSQLNRDPFSPEEEALVLSTRVRVGRNLADYPLGPGVTREQRNEIESKVTQALSNMEGDLKGQYYSLSSMTDEQRKQLIEDHFLFKEGDRFLEACGLNRDWPEGRGIFHNDAKTFLVWVNEEDQLRIISMQKGAGLLEVFVRLSKACKAIEDVAKFAHDDHLGYITSCPTNLGTALRASVHIQLPLLGCQKDKFQAIADKYYVQIRGAHGEHTETDDHIYDISNKRRLGRGEVELVQDMYDGVKEMMAVELALQKEKAEKEAEEERKRKEAEAEEEAKKKAAAEEEEKKK
jgi:creatine kinase